MGVRIVGAVVAIGLLVRMILTADLTQVGHCLGRAGPWAWALPLPFGVMMLCETLGWSSLLRRVGERPRFASLMRVRVMCEALALSLPGGAFVADGAKIALGHARLGLPTVPTTATVAAAKPLTTAALAFYVFVALLVSLVFARHLDGSTLRFLLVGADVVLVAVSAGMFFALRGAPAGGLRRLLARVPSHRLRTWLLARRAGFERTDVDVHAIVCARARQLVVLAAPFAAGLFVQAFETGLLLTLAGVRLPVADIIRLDAAMLVVRSMAFFVPSGLGVVDASYIAALGALGVPDHESVGTAFALLKRGKEVVCVIVGYALFAIKSRRSQFVTARAHIVAAR